MVFRDCRLSLIPFAEFYLVKKSPLKSENAEKPTPQLPMTWLKLTTILDSLTGGLFNGRTGVLQALLHRARGLPGPFTQPVLGLPEKNLRPLFSLLRFLLLGDEIAD